MEHGSGGTLQGVSNVCELSYTGGFLGDKFNFF